MTARQSSPCRTARRTAPHARRRALEGAGSAAKRAALLARLLGAATAAEQEFLLRLLSGELRQGALDGVMIDAIAAAAKLPVPAVRRAAMYAPARGELAAAAMVGGETALVQFGLRLLQPVVPMLAQTAADVGEALQELPAPVQFEWKMDGARIQVHKRGDAVHIYTRALSEIGAAIPEVVAAVRALPAAELILRAPRVTCHEPITTTGSPKPGTRE